MLSNFEPETFYHLFNHAVGNENFFREEKNYLYFLKKMAFYLPPVCKTYAYCLLPNHFHILVKFHDEKTVLAFQEEKAQKNNTTDFHKTTMKQFKNLCSGYAQAYNKMYDRKGALFFDYIKRKKVQKDTYFSELIRYIHLNPVYHGFCKTPFEWKFSSIHAFFSKKKTLIQREEVLEWFGNVNEFEKYHQIFDLYNDFSAIIE